MGASGRLSPGPPEILQNLFCVGWKTLFLLLSARFFQVSGDNFFNNINNVYNKNIAVHSQVRVCFRSKHARVYSNCDFIYFSFLYLVPTTTCLFLFLAHVLALLLFWFFSLTSLYKYMIFLYKTHIYAFNKN